MKSATASNRPTLKLTFDDKPYSYGSIIEVRVDVTSKNPMALREGKVDLVCHDAVLVLKRSRSNMFAHNAAPPLIADLAYRTSVHSNIKKEKVERLFQSVAFKSEALNTKSNRIFHLKIKIPVEKPPDEGLVERKWWLVAKLNIAKSRDVIVRKQVHIT